MVDVDRRVSGLNPAHIAGLRRLSARATARLTFPESRSLFRSSESDPLTLRRQRSVSEKSDAGGGRTPRWVERYVGEMGSVLREGGWCESDIAEISGVSASGFFEEDTVLLDSEAVLDALLLKTDRLSDSLRKAGWSSEEVSEVLGFESPAKKLSPERIGKLAESVSRS